MTPRAAPDLDRLHTQACGLAHEGRAGRGFCAKAARAGNLACAHTMARYVLRDALERLVAQDAPGAQARLEDWSALDLAVGLSDHARSQAEKTGDAAAIAAAVSAHGRAAADLERLRLWTRAALGQANTAS